jgi:hypothetical protein
MTVNRDGLIAFFVFFLSLIALSSVFHGLFSVPSSLVYYPLLTMLTLYLLGQRGIKIECYIFIVIFLLFLFLMMLATLSEENIKRYMFQPIGILCCALFARETSAVIRYINISSIFIFFAISLSLLGLGYAFLGNPPNFVMHNTDGRENFFYLSTFSNAVYGNVIRPSFIYDEPGAFSFVICTVVALRELYGKVRYNAMLLFLGIITFSLTHIVIMCVFIATNVRRKSSVIIIAVASVTSFFVYNMPEFDFFFSRLKISDGKLAGDTRTSQLDNFKRVFDEKIFFLGDYECHGEYVEKCASHGDMGSSPVTPLYRGGIIQLIIQVITHSLFLLYAFRSRRHVFPAITMSILILQRPFFEGLSYQMMIYIVLFCMVLMPRRLTES